MKSLPGNALWFEWGAGAALRRVAVPLVVTCGLCTDSANISHSGARLVHVVT